MSMFVDCVDEDGMSGEVEENTKWSIFKSQFNWNEWERKIIINFWTKETGYSVLLYYV